MYKLKSLVLAAIGFLCNLNVSAHDFEVDGIYYNITSSADMMVEVTYRGDNSMYYDEYSGAVSIPESVTYNSCTYDVTSIGYEAFWGCSSLTLVEIPNSVTTIGSGAFVASGVYSVTIGDGVTTIPNDMFQNCTNLAEVKIGNSVTKIEYQAFYLCSNLTSVVIPNSVTKI